MRPIFLSFTACLATVECFHLPTPSKILPSFEKKSYSFLGMGYMNMLLFASQKRGSDGDKPKIDSNVKGGGENPLIDTIHIVFGMNGNDDCKNFDIIPNIFQSAVEEKEDIEILNLKSGVNKVDDTRLRKRDLIKSILRRLANLSLQDYSWRSDYFKQNEADRRVEESLARMMGEEASYVRPMDASQSKIGPLGRLEKSLVDWLSLVIEEEGRRAQMIASSKGDLVRPMDLKGDQGGPLSVLENSAVNFINAICRSETERIKSRTFRPKDLDIEKRGPLGNFEAKVVNALDDVLRSEKLRLEQTCQRGGELVRPIDVPGPLGELERWYLELITAEHQRGKDRQKNDGKLVRPQDSSIMGPMGFAERQVSEILNYIKNEENARLKSMQKVLEDNRPMERNRDSALGWIEAAIVGILRAPQILFRVIDRVNELLQTETLSEKDNVI